MAEIQNALGLMSGTSMDGIDLAMLATDGEAEVRRGSSMMVPYAPDLRERIEKALDLARSLEEPLPLPESLTKLQRDITQAHIAAVQAFLERFDLDSDAVDLIGFHGQTILHRPEHALTIQLGDGQAMADALGIPVIYDLRQADLQAGGQGAPLVPVYHAALAALLPDELQAMHPKVFVNIGGISNLTFIDQDGTLMATDAGPGNALIDQWMQSEAGIPYDAGGRIGGEGSISQSIAGRYLAAPFFDKPMPKSLDRLDFPPLVSGEAELSDGARTLCYVSAAAIIKSLEAMPVMPALMILCGGGRHNQGIVGDLKKLVSLHDSKVIPAEEGGLDGDAMEAEAWAYLAVRAKKGLPITYPATTGCREPTSGGRRALPR